jgi:aminopeptidase N
VYDLYQKDLVNLVVHEVAHQWWYNIVGSDQVRNPWLDEGLAEFSMYYYFALRDGEGVAEDLQALRWQLPITSLRRRNADQPIGRAVWDYTKDYEMVVYAKGALFFAKLREEIGPALFAELLRTWARDGQWRVGTPAQFQALASRIAGKNLDALFNEWVYPSEVQNQ